VTELLCTEVAVRTDAAGVLTAVRTSGGWQTVTRTTNHWIVDGDWWRDPVRRDYRRCLLGGGDCIELYSDLETGTWWLSRRYD